MKQIAYLGALLLLGIAATSETVHAQAPGTAPAPASQPTPRTTQGWDGSQTWSLGLRTVSRTMNDTEAQDSAEGTDLAGAGLQLRYRRSARWEFELAIEGAEAQLVAGSLVQRSQGATLSAIYHMRPHRNWGWYLLAGVGGSEERFEHTTKQGATEEVFSQSHLQLGIGLERRFRRFGVGAELRAIGASLDPEAGDAPAYMDAAAPVPAESSGGQLNLTATYYF